jgi:hypothetical protein
VDADRHQLVVELVRERAREATEGIHALGRLKLSLEALPLGALLLELSPRDLKIRRRTLATCDLTAKKQKHPGKSYSQKARSLTPACDLSGRDSEHKRRIRHPNARAAQHWDSCHDTHYCRDGEERFVRIPPEQQLEMYGNGNRRKRWNDRRKGSARTHHCEPKCQIRQPDQEPRPEWIAVVRAKEPPERVGASSNAEQNAEPSLFSPF